MISPRIRRLQNDYKNIKHELSGHPYIKVVPTEGNPPERYLLAYKVRGLMLDKTKTPVEIDHHEFEMYLHSDYPREKPRIFTKSTIFHPNISDWVCIGDHWASGETLVDVIIQLGEMIQYRTYNTKSPLNGIAAKWANENAHLLPVGTIDLYQPEPEIELKTGSGNKEIDDFEITLK